MGFLFGGGGGLPAKDQAPLGLDTNRSASYQAGRVLPLLYGRQRIGAQFISDAFDIKIVGVNTGGKSSTKAGNEYYASFAVAICHGPVTAFHDMYLNGDPVFLSSVVLNPSPLTMTNNVATFQTVSPHGLQTGDVVFIANANRPEFNGEFTITVVSPTQFQYIIPGSSKPSETTLGVSGKRITCRQKLPPIYASGSLYPTTIPIPNFGDATIHWGADPQGGDTYLSDVSGIDHPGYGGICYIVFNQLFLGFNQTNVQNVEVVVERTPAFTGMSVPGHAVINGDCNPACILADLLLNQRCGLALDESDVDLAGLDAAAEQFYAEGVGLSPLISRPEELRSQLVEILGTVDAAPVLNAAGQISIALQRMDSLQSLTVNDALLTQLPTFDPTDWSSVINETNLNFTNRDAGWVSDFVTWKDNAGMVAKNRPEPAVLDKTFVTQKSVAESLVNIAGQVNALPAATGKLQLAFNADNFATLAPGNAFRFEFAHRPALNGIYRVLSRTLPDPAKPVFEIEVALDRSYLYPVTLSSAAPQTMVPPGTPVPELDMVAPNTFALIELPSGLRPNSLPAIAFLAQRDLNITVSAQIWLGRNYVFNGAAPESFLLLGTLSRFALHGALVADFGAATDFLVPANALPAEADQPLPLTTGLQVQLDGPDVVLPDVSDFDALAGAVLLFCEGEVMAIAEAVLSGVGAYTLTVIRGRFGTPIIDHAAGATLFVIARADLVALQHPHFLAGNIGHFKLVLDWQSVSDVDAFDVVFSGAVWP